MSGLFSKLQDHGVVHRGVSCDVCDECPIQGHRWKCTVCQKYDMCSSCYKDYRWLHDHSFQKIVFSHKRPYEDYEEDEGELPSGYHAGTDESSTKRKKTSAEAGATKGQLKCDVCRECPIQGVSWKCIDCVDCHICSFCFHFFRNKHAPSHSFTKIETPEQQYPGGSVDVKSKKTSGGDLPDRVKCEVCSECPIKGVRWKCNDCADYHMCSSCKKVYTKVHARSHTFKKLERPKKRTRNANDGQGAAKRKTKTASTLPSTWAHMQNDELVKRVRLPTTSLQFLSVKEHFMKTMSRTTIIRIERIQSKFLWEHFYYKRVQMEKLNGPVGTNELNLFHGTKAELIEDICHQNLDIRLAGSNVGAILGRGTYFSREATYSDSYATPDPHTGHKYMLQCRVLVGRYAKGKQGLKRPPEMKGSTGPNRLYDSCVENVNNPFIFCIFDHVQCYPEYIIEYE